MTLVKIDIRNVASETHPDDRVLIRSATLREASGGGLISTAETSIPLVDGVGEVDLAPGSVVVNFQCRGISDTSAKSGIVPDEGTVDIAEVIEGGLTFTPPVVNRALDMIHAERDHLLTDMATTVSEAVDGELGTAVRNAETAAVTAGKAATSADLRATSAESKVDSYTPRVVALEAMNGVSPESPVDGQTANLIEQEDTLTRQALDGTFMRVADEPLVMRNQPGVDPTGQQECGAAIRLALAKSKIIDWGKPGDVYVVARDGSNAWALPVHEGQQWIGNGAVIKLADNQSIFTSVVHPIGNNWKLDNFTIDGNRSTQSDETQTTRHGLALDNTRGGIFTRLDIKECAGEAINCWREVWDITGRDTRLHDVDRAGISFTGSGGDILLENVHGYNIATQAFDAEVDTGLYTRVTARSCTWEHGPTDYAIDLNGKEYPATDFKFIDNVIIGGVHLSGVKNVVFNGGSIDATTGQYGCVSGNYGMDGLLFSDMRMVTTGTRDSFRVDWHSSGTTEADNVILSNIVFFTETGNAVNINGFKRVRLENLKATGTPTQQAGASAILGYAGFLVKATRTLETVSISGCVSSGYARNVYLEVNNLVKYARLENNHMIGALDEEHKASEVYATQVAGASANVPNLMVSNNTGYSLNSTFTPFSAPAGTWVRRSGGARRNFFEGSGTPEGVVSGRKGDMAVRIDGDSATTLYVKTTDFGNTGWVPK